MKKIPLKLSTDPASEDAVSRSPLLLAMGFRPFFLLAPLFAAVVTLGWMLILSGSLAAPTYLPSNLWHAHEMIFGFGLAVVAGFLLTAARKWTGLDTLHGYPLMGLVVVWGAGRILMFLPVPGWLIAATQVVFPLALMMVMTRVIIRGRSRRNYGHIVILGAFTAASIAIQAQAIGWTEATARPALYGALHALVLLNVIIGGRIIPIFTRNKTKEPTSSVPQLGAAAIALAAGVGVLSVLGAAQVAVDPRFVSIVSAAAGVLVLARMRNWQTLKALRVPLLAVLHVGYIWIGVGYGLLSLATWMPSVSLPVALHGLSIGVVGTMTAGMIGRVSLGHTGRVIRASNIMKLAFHCVTFATMARLSALVLAPSATPTTWMISGSLFALTYMLLFVAIVRPLATPRPDGKPG